MKSRLVNPFCEEPIQLPALLDYADWRHVEDKARIGMTLELHNACAIKTPPPKNHMHYVDLLRQTGHQLENVASFNQTLTGDNDSSNKNKSDERRSTSKKQQKKEQVSGNCNPKAFTTSNKPPQQKTSECAEKYRNIPDTITDKCRRLEQYRSCGQNGHCWRVCTVPQSVVASSQLSRRRKASDNETTRGSVPKARRVAVAPVGQKATQVRGSPPQILEKNTDTSV